jgi:DNA-binding NtrC family response regulator
MPGTAARSFAPDAIKRLGTYAWPGNIRELRNVVERLVLMNPATTNRPITLEDIAQVLPKTTPGIDESDSTQLSMDDMERLHILRVLDASGGNKTQAAKTLQIDYKTLLTKLKKYGLAP